MIEARDERALNHRAHAVQAFEVPDLVRQDGDHVVGVLGERDEPVGHDHDAGRKCHRIRAKRLTLAELEARAAGELRWQPIAARRPRSNPFGGRWARRTVPGRRHRARPDT